MISIQQAALLYCIDVRTIKNWARKHQITISKIGNTWMIDELNLKRIIELNAEISNYDIYLEKIVEIKKKELASVILQIDDLLYLFKSINKIAPVFRILVREIAFLIPEGKLRSIFIDVTMKNKLSEIAEKYCISYERLRLLYETGLRCVDKKSKFLLNYRKVLADKEFKIRKLETEARRRDCEIQRLSAIFKRINYEGVLTNQEIINTPIPYEIFERLSIRLEEKIDLDTRTFHCLKRLNFETVEDVLRYIKDKGVKNLRDSGCIGAKSLEKLKAGLIQIEVIDENWDSVLFQYL